MDASTDRGSPDVMLLDSTQPTPLYHQLYLILRDRIRTGRYEADSLLPTEYELTAQFKVSRITAKRALNELAADGLITRHRGRGSVVAATRLTPIVKGSIFSLIESLKQMGLETEVRLIEAETVPASTEVARLLDLPAQAPVQRAVRLRSLDGEPFSHLLTYVPSAIAEGYAVADLSTMPLLTLLERAGVEVVEAEQWIGAAAAEPAIATALDVPPTSPLLRIERVMRDRSGCPVELLYAHYRSDRFQYHLKSSRREFDPAATRIDKAVQ